MKGISSFLVDELYYLEWHDGLVRGIIESGHRTLLAALVAWDPSTRKRAYMLLEIAREDSERLKLFSGLKRPLTSELEARWREMENEWERVVTTPQADPLITRVEPTKGACQQVFVVSRPEAAALVSFDLENALGKTMVDKWLGGES